MKRYSGLLAVSFVALSAGLAACGSSGGGAGLCYAADGTNGERGNLYTIDLLSGERTVVGEIGYSVASLALGPDGTLFASSGGADEDNETESNRNLLVIDTGTGAGEIIGPTVDDEESDYNVNGITFVGSTLYGLTTGYDSLSGYTHLVTLDPETGEVLTAGPNNEFDGVDCCYSGNDLTTDEDGNVWGSTWGGEENGFIQLFTIDTDTGVGEVELVPTAGEDEERLKGLTFVDGTLYTILFANGWEADQEVHSLVSIDMDTGEIEEIVQLPVAVQAISCTP